MRPTPPKMSKQHVFTSQPFLVPILCTPRVDCNKENNIAGFIVAFHFLHSTYALGVWSLVCRTNEVRLKSYSLSLSLSASEWEKQRRTIFHKMPKHQTAQFASQQKERFFYLWTSCNSDKSFHLSSRYANKRQTATQNFLPPRHSSFFSCHVSR